MKKSSFFLAMGVILCLSLTAEGPPRAGVEPDGAAVWKSVGPTGGGAIAVAINPANPAEVYAASSGNQAQVFRSSNGGASWTRQSVFSSQLFDLELAPGNPNVLYALGADTLYKSLNKGVSWTPLELENLCQTWGGRMFLSPANPNTLFVPGTRAYQTSPSWLYCPAIFRSTDGGETWTVTQFQPDTDYGYIQLIAGCPATPQTIYAAGYGHRAGGTTNYLFKSTNNGGTWAKIAEVNTSVTGLLVHPADANRVWYATYSGVFRSADGGSSWQQSTGYISAYALAMDRTNSQILFAGGTGGCYKSTDGGITWNGSATPPAGTAKDIAAGGAAVLCGSSGGLFRSTDAGTSFTASHNGYKATDITALASAPSSPATMYAESSGAAFFKTTNAGATWKALPYFYRCEAVLKIAVETASANKIYILAGG